jgi:hypothetical protein
VRLSVVFDVLRLLPAADDGCIRFCFRGGQHSSQTFCVDALRNYLGSNFVDLYRTVTKEDMEELAVEQQHAQNS